jgi:hypothetical protein
MMKIVDGVGEEGRRRRDDERREMRMILRVLSSSLEEKVSEGERRRSKTLGHRRWANSMWRETDGG